MEKIGAIKKPNTPELHYVQGPTKSLPYPMQIGASGKTVQKKRHNLTGHNSPVGYGLNVFYLVGFGRICRKMRTVFN
jgi:hypothetical protein